MIAFLAVYLSMASLVAPKLLWGGACPDNTPTHAVDRNDFENLWYAIKLDRNDFLNDCQAFKFTYSDTGMYEVQKKYNLLNLSWTESGMMKVDHNTGESYLNLWYWLDTTMSGNPNFLIVYEDSHKMISYQCSVPIWFFGAVIDEQLAVYSRTMSLSTDQLGGATYYIDTKFPDYDTTVSFYDNILENCKYTWAGE